MTKKLVLAVLSVVAVVVALGTSTFAWFTLSQTADIGTIEVNVESGEGIEISLDGGTTWRSSYTTAELEAAISKANPEYWNTNVISDPEDGELISGEFLFSAVKLTAVTPEEDFAGFHKFKLPGGVNYGNTADAEKNHDYIEFDLMIRVRGARGVANWVRPTNETSKPVVRSSGKDWNSDQNFSYNGTLDVVSGTAYRASAQNAMRVSVGHTIVEADSGAYGAGTTSATIFPNQVLGNGSGLNNTQGSHAYFNKKTNDAITTTMIDAAKIKLATFQETYAENSDDYRTITVSELGAEIGTNPYNLTDKFIYNAADGWSTTKGLKVRIWIEGWDFDTLDAVYSDNMITNLMFIAGTASADNPTS